ncbi:MAG: hypothetical protein H8E86_04545 [Planctomycetes bacterium]|nr:hypothetical protein [Planctomycetota bacterium]
MIEVLLACSLLQAPLALTGDKTGAWFIGDISPTQATFSGLPLDVDFELCERVSREEYEVLQLFTRRPLAIALDKKTVWYIDRANGVGLYRLQLSVHTKSVLHPSTLEAFIETANEPTDFLLLDGLPTLALGDLQNDVLTVSQFRDRKWEPLPLLQGKHARIAQIQGQLIAVVPSDTGGVMWTLKEGSWQEGDAFTYEGKLVQLLSHEDWPILVTSQNGNITLRGIRRGGLVEIASFATPKGRWGVSSSTGGITVIGVQRKGIITLIDIGWPSGSVSAPIILNERKKAGSSVVTTLLFVSMVAVSLFLILRIRATVQKPA